MKFCDKHKLLSSAQFSFSSKTCSIRAIATVTVTEYIESEIGRKSTCQECFIDLSKSFDTIHHKNLHKKIEAYGFRVQFVKLLQNYLQNRSQKNQYYL